MNDLSLMIFAAGFGTRMGHLTEYRPKPLVPVAGRALIEYALDIARANDIASVVTNAHYKHEQLTAYFAKTTIRVLVEQPDILDTGGGCKAALPFLKGDTLVTLNSDAVWSHPVNLEPMFEIWDPRRSSLPSVAFKFSCGPPASFLVTSHVSTISRILSPNCFSLNPSFKS